MVSARWKLKYQHKARSFLTPNTLGVSPSPATFVAGAASGTPIVVLTGVQASGSTLSIPSGDTHIALSPPNVLVGLTPSTAGTFSVVIRETNPLFPGLGYNDSTIFFTATSGTSAVPPGAIVLNTDAELGDALYNGPPGTNYVLAPRAWGGQSFYGPRNSQTSTVPIHIYGQPGVLLDYLFIDTGKYIQFHYLTATGGNPSQGVLGLGCGNSTEIVFDHCLSAGTGQGTGFSIGYSTNCSVLWCKASFRGLGFAVVRSTNTLVEDCWSDGTAADAFDVFGSTSTTQRRCLVTNPGVDTGHQDVNQWSHYTAQGSPPVTYRNDGINLVEYINFDRGTSTSSPQGQFFADSTDNVTVRHCASFGSMYNGISVDNGHNVSIDNIYLNSWDYSVNVVIRDGSDNVTVNRVQTTGGVFDAAAQPLATPPEPGNTNVTITNTTIIAQATSSSDRATYLAFLAANLGIPTVSHWDNAGYI